MSTEKIKKPFFDRIGDTVNDLQLLPSVRQRESTKIQTAQPKQNIGC